MKEEESNLSIEYWKNGRFIIVDKETGEIVDDAQGYGYKDKQKAAKAMWWKFKGGREKRNVEKNQLKEWLKEPENKKIYKAIDREIFSWAFEIGSGEMTTDEVILGVEKELNVKIPHFVKKNILK